MAFNRINSPMVVTLLVQQYNNVGEKPTVVIILYAYINRHAGTPKAETNDTMSLVTGQFCYYYIGSRIGWYGCQSYKKSC